MDNLGALFDVIKANSADVEKVIAQFGGIGPTLAITPALLRIAMTIAKHHDPVAAAEHAENVLAYGEETKEKVKEFQRKHHLIVDGIVGKRTWQVVEDQLHVVNSGL